MWTHVWSAQFAESNEIVKVKIVGINFRKHDFLKVYRFIENVTKWKKKIELNTIAFTFY